MLKVSLSGTDAFARRLQTIESNIRSAAAEAVRDGAERIAEDARAHVRAQTEGSGELEDSIRTVVSDDGLLATVEATAPHAGFVEYGTVSQPARPFLGPAVEANRQTIIDNIAAAIRRAVKT